MMSLGGKVIDVFDDPGLKLLASSPYFGKIGSLELGDPSKLGDLEDGQFGVVFLTKKGDTIRKYPLNDFTNTALSNIYFEMTADKLPPEAKVAAATQIKAASEVFGFAPLPLVEKFAVDVSATGRNYVSLEKVASQGAQPFDSLKALHDAYADNRDGYTRADRIELARAMAGAGEKFGFALHEDLKPFAIKEAEVNEEAFFSQCALRKQLLQEKAAGLHLMDEMLEKHASFGAAETIRLLETFDKQFGLTEYWERGLEPHLVLREKIAMHAVPVSSGTISFSDDEVKAWAASNGETLRKMFGQELADKIAKDPKSMWCLPEASRGFLSAHIESSRDNSPTAAK
jgi:hypothetical protein